MPALFCSSRSSHIALATGLAVLLALGAIGLAALSPTEAHAAAKPKISSTSNKVVKGKTFILKVKNAGGKKVTWKSSNKKVATVSKKGKVTAKKAGSTTITATVAGKKLTCKVKVYGSAKQKALASLDGWWHTYSAFGAYMCIKDGRMYRFNPNFNATNETLDDYYSDSTSHVERYKLSLIRVKHFPLDGGSGYTVKANGKTWYRYYDNDHKTLSFWSGTNYSGSSSLERVSSSEVPSNLKKYMKAR